VTLKLEDFTTIRLLRKMVNTDLIRGDGNDGFSDAACKDNVFYGFDWRFSEPRKKK
jgi:hypothetical protein